MPVELNDLINDKRWVEVPIGNHAIKVAYHPNAVSLRRQAELQRKIRELQTNEAADEMEVAMISAGMFCEKVCDWDLTSGGRPIPVSPESVVGLSEFVINAIMEAVQDDGKAQADEKKLLRARSGAGLPVEAKLEKSLNGTQSYERHDTWAQ